MKTINNLSSTASLSLGDLLALWSTNNGDTRKVSLTTLIDFIKAQGGESGLTTLLTFDQLRDIDPTNSDSLSQYLVLGDITVNDGKGGIYYWDALSTATDDSFLVIDSNHTINGRWLRLDTNNILVVDTVTDMDNLDLTVMGNTKSVYVKANSQIFTHDGSNWASNFIIDDTSKLPSSPVSGDVVILRSSGVTWSYDGSNWVPENKTANVLDYGVIGTADDTSVFQAAFNSGYNIEIPDGTYNVGNLTLNTEGQRIISNKVVFAALNNTDYVLTVNAKYVKIGNLDISFSDAVSAATYRGINILNSFFQADRIRVTYTTKGAGTSGTYNAVNIGDGITQLSQIKIGYLGIYGFDYPYYFNYVDTLEIDYLKCEFYRRGTYLKDCTNVDVKTLWAGSISPNAVGSAGENALLVEATKANDSSSDINIDNIKVIGSGEHGVRIGGQFTINGFSCDNMYVKNPGSGVGTGVDPDNHGGCGFKVLGPTSLAANIKHKNISVSNITVENVYNVTNPDRLNFAGVQLGKCEFVQIDNIQVIPEIIDGVATTFCARDGLEIVGCNDVVIGEVKVVNPKYAGLYIYSGPAFVPVTYEYYWDKNKNIKIENVSIVDSDDAIVLTHELDDTNDMENISIDNVDIINATRGIYVYEVAGGYKGTFTNCSIKGKAVNVSSSIALAPLAGLIFDLQARNCTVPVNRVGDVGTSFLDLDTGREVAIRDTNSDNFSEQSKTMQFSIADDGVVSFDTFAYPHFISVAAGGVAEYAQLWVRPTVAPANIGLHLGASVETANTALTGTTGTDTKLTVGIQNGKIYIENRLGAVATVTVSDMV